MAIRYVHVGTGWRHLKIRPELIGSADTDESAAVPQREWVTT